MQSFAALAERYLKHQEVSGAWSRRVQEERRPLIDHFLVTFGNRETLDPWEYMDWIDSHDDWRAAWTRWEKNKIIQAWLNWCELVKLAVNPLKTVSYPEGDRRVCVHDHVFRRLLKAVEPGFRRFLFFLRRQGMREGEACRLRWDWIDWELGVALIPAACHKTGYKTKKPAMRVLMPEVVKLLHWMQARAAGALVFTNQKGTGWTRSSLSQKLARLRRRLGIPEEFKLHGIRHQFGTEAVRNGGNTKLISLGMGHSSVRVTEKFYLHLEGDVEAIRREMAKAVKR